MFVGRARLEACALVHSPSLTVASGRASPVFQDPQRKDKMGRRLRREVREGSLSQRKGLAGKAVAGSPGVQGCLHVSERGWEDVFKACLASPRLLPAGDKEPER